MYRLCLHYRMHLQNFKLATFGKIFGHHIKFTKIIENFSFNHIKLAYIDVRYCQKNSFCRYCIIENLIMTIFRNGCFVTLSLFNYYIILASRVLPFMFNTNYYTAFFYFVSFTHLCANDIYF